MNAKYTKIFNTAVNLFITGGIKKTTMDELASAANVSKVTIYKYFGDKDALYHKVGKQLLDECQAELTAHLDTEMDISAKITAVLDTLTAFIISGKLTLTKQLVKFSDALKTDFDAFNGAYKSAVLQLIRDGKGASLINADIDDEHLYYYIDMGLNYFENNKAYRDRVISDETFKQDFMRFLLNNIFID